MEGEMKEYYEALMQHYKVMMLLVLAVTVAFSGMLLFVTPPLPFLLTVLIFVTAISITRIYCREKRSLQSMLSDLKEGRYQILDAYCLDTEYGEDTSKARIKIMSRDGQECPDWLEAPRAIAKSFDSLQKRMGGNVDYRIMVMKLNSGMDYHIVKEEW
uniref:hypothetical protein n=1 Tax=Lachnoclostridium phocaeense TaxID=1871021 RepID=UPI0026DBE60B|nr:hypothetical protein [Lachnoclostridium phocaeense]